MQIKKIRLQRNGNKKTYINLPIHWLNDMGIDTNKSSMEELELLYNEAEKTITIKRSY